MQASQITHDLSPITDKLEHAVQMLTLASGSQTKMMRQLVREFNAYVDEYQYLPTSASLVLQPQSRNLERITCLIAIVSSTGGQLTLGTRVIPLPIGVTVWSNVSFLLKYEDPRIIAQSTSGVLALELMGIEIPEKGPF